MNDVKLTDFTERQLQILLVEVVAACEREAYERMGKSQRGDSYDDLSLWRTQILNAISTVKMRERTESN